MIFRDILYSGDPHAGRDNPSQASIRLASQQVSVGYIASLRAASSHSLGEFCRGTLTGIPVTHTHTHFPFVADVGCLQRHLELRCLYFTKALSRHSERGDAARAAHFDADSGARDTSLHRQHISMTKFTTRLPCKIHLTPWIRVFFFF